MLPAKAFNKRTTRRDGLTSSCAQCKREYNRGHYKANKAYYVLKAAKRNARERAEIREFIFTLKLQPCTDCKKSFHPCVMDFDHVRGKKLFVISDGLRDAITRTRLRAELDKCDLVCANCHRLRTYRRASVA